MYAYDKATIHLHGEATAVHSNKGYGILAYNTAKVIIHLPSHHNTSYNNTGEDRINYKRRRLKKTKVRSEHPKYFTTSHHYLSYTK